MPYIYNDEDNAPMTEDAFKGYHNPTVYNDRAEMKYYESGEWIQDLEKREKPANGCWNCRNFDWTREACTTNWNNMDESYYNPDIDDREPTDYCDDHDLDPDVKPEDWDFGGNEP